MVDSVEAQRPDVKPSRGTISDHNGSRTYEVAGDFPERTNGKSFIDRYELQLNKLTREELIERYADRAWWRSSLNGAQKAEVVEYVAEMLAMDEVLNLKERTKGMMVGSMEWITAVMLPVDHFDEIDGGTGLPPVGEWVRWFCTEQKCDPFDEVTVIEFYRVPPIEMIGPDGHRFTGEGMCEKWCMAQCQGMCGA